jgi:DNA invertase Pin-like site-specific DNA recombinase
MSTPSLLRDYAGAHGFDVLKEFTDVETAKAAGRTSFGEMIALLQKTKTCRTVLVEKTDRLYRNLKDWVTILLKGISFSDETLALGCAPSPTGKPPRRTPVS